MDAVVCERDGGTFIDVQHDELLFQPSSKERRRVNFQYFVHLVPAMHCSVIRTMHCGVIRISTAQTTAHIR